MDDGMQGSKRTRLAKLEQAHRIYAAQCPLADDRENYVFGEGDPDADLAFVGEAPGAAEDESGRPFVGPSGELLNRGLDALGLGRGDIYIANVLKCRPPDNRDRHWNEVGECMPVLRAQLSIVRPAAVVVLGASALDAVCGVNSVGRHRGEALTPTWSADFDVWPVYHPAYVLRGGCPEERWIRDLVDVRGIFPN